MCVTVTFWRDPAVIRLTQVKDKVNTSKYIFCFLSKLVSKKETFIRSQTFKKQGNSPTLTHSSQDLANIKDSDINLTRLEWLFFRLWKAVLLIIQFYCLHCKQQYFSQIDLKTLVKCLLTNQIINSHFCIKHIHHLHRVNILSHISEMARSLKSPSNNSPLKAVCFPARPRSMQIQKLSDIQFGSVH